mgnify:CR=1 FL=1
MTLFRKRNWKAIIHNQLEHPRMGRLRRTCATPLLLLAVAWLCVGTLLGSLASAVAGDRDGDDPDEVMD